MAGAVCSCPAEGLWKVFLLWRRAVEGVPVLEKHFGSTTQR
jgi:hypothetical protein